MLNQGRPEDANAAQRDGNAATSVGGVRVAPPSLLAGAGVALGLAVCAALGWAIGLTHQVQVPIALPSVFLPQVRQSAQAPASNPVVELPLSVQRGDTLDSLFRANQLPLTDLAAILGLDDARQNLRFLRPGEELLVRQQAGKVLALERQLDATSVLRVKRIAGTYSASVVQLPLEPRRVAISGRISSSLFEAAAEAELSDNMIMKLAQIFAYDIDFVRDVGTCDEFTLVYDELWRNGERLGEGEILAAQFINRGTRYTAIRFDRGDGRADYYAADGRPLRKAFLRVPVSFTRISSNFNPRRRHPILNTIRAHTGVDYAAPTGTPIKAAGDGKVIFRGRKGGYGNTIILQHGGKISTLYGHMSRFASSVRYGGRVRQGDVIGYVGATGLATAPHLHYEYRINGVHMNPRTVELPGAEPLHGRELTAFATQTKPLMARLDTGRSVFAANLE